MSLASSIIIHKFNNLYFKNINNVISSYFASKPHFYVINKVSITVRDVNDEKPEFQFPVYKGQIKEDATDRSHVLDVKAVDEDTEGTVRKKD